MFEVGYSLVWVGAVTFISSFFIWKRNKYAMFLATLVGSFVEIGAYLPSPVGIKYALTVETIIHTAIALVAIILSIHFIYSDKQTSRGSQVSV